MNDVTSSATVLQLLGAGGFGIIIGWYVYYINRYRKEDVSVSDLSTIIGIIGGGAITVLFPEKTDLFGAYGIGLFIGFFGYFISLIILVYKSKNFNADWFLDGRRKKIGDDYYIPKGSGNSGRAMNSNSSNIND